MILTDLRELKAELEVLDSDTVEDKKLLLFAEAASDMIEEYLGRKVGKEARTEYYSGTNTQFLPLRCRPVFTSPTILVSEDSSGFWGTTSGAFPSDTALTYGVDFGLQIDQDDGTSRSGVLVKINRYWDRPYVRRAGLLSPYFDHANGNIKVTYTAGYSVDKLPAAIRFACNALIMRMNHLMPFGFPTTGDTYEERSLQYQLPQRNVLMDQIVKPLLFSHRNFKW